MGQHKYLIKHLAKNKVRSAIEKYDITQKATITDEQSAFKSDVNSLYISNINMKGLRDLSYLKYQEYRLKQFLNKNTGMKMLIHADTLNKDGDTSTSKPREYEELNTGDISDVMTKMAKDIDTQIEHAQLSKPNIAIERVSQITISYDKYNPTRAGSYVKLPEWLPSQKSMYQH